MKSNLVFVDELEGKYSLDRKKKLSKWVSDSEEARKNKSLDRAANQADKAEELLTWYTFAPLLRMSSEQRDEVIRRLVKPVYPSIVSEKNFEVSFETQIAPPVDYLRVLEEQATKSHPVRYVRETASRHVEFKKKLEGETHLDVLIENENFLIPIEAKFTSDIAHETYYGVERNQIARVIDATLDLAKSNQGVVFLLCVPDKMVNTRNRLYAYKMEEYKSNPNSLYRDLIHRPGELKALKGIDYITWEKTAQIIYENSFRLSKWEKDSLIEFYSDRLISVDALSKH